jgi:hypothetical protein
MTDEERSLLERTYKLAEENNEILRAMRRANRFSTVMRILYWVAIIGLSFGAYYLIQPYINATMDAYSQLSGSINGVEQKINSAQNTIDTFKSYLP